MKRLFAVAVFLGLCSSLSADVPTPVKDWPEPTQVLRLWPGYAPGLVEAANPETIIQCRIKNVSVPELWVYLPKESQKHRVALMICPGGGYGHLAMGLHMGNVVRLFNDQGIVVLGLKYRTRYGKNNVSADAAMDCMRAVRLMRQHAEEWGIDPARIGVQGYSAGANICLNLLGLYDDGNTAGSDPVEKFSCRPDFVALMCLWPAGKSAPDYPIRPNPPPVFMASAEDDQTAPIAFSREIAEKLKAQGGTVEFFAVPTGGHGAFHYGVSNGPGAKWPEAFLPFIPKAK